MVPLGNLWHGYVRKSCVGTVSGVIENVPVPADAVGDAVGDALLAAPKTVHAHLTALVLRCLAPSPSRVAVTHIDAAPSQRPLGVSHVPQRRVGTGLPFGLGVISQKVEANALRLHLHSHVD